MYDIGKLADRSSISYHGDSAIAKNGVTTAELSASIDLALRRTSTEANRRPMMVDVAVQLYDMIISSVPPIPTTSSGV